MKVSIITICYNSESTVGETIDSVLAQDYNNIEYILVDGKSSDRTLAKIQSYGDQISKVVCERDKGIYDAMNKGLAQATGDIVGFMNSDDVFNSSDCVSEIVRTFQSEEQVDVVYGDKIYVDPEDTSKVVRFWKVGPFDRKNYKKGWMSPHLSTYIKKDLYDKFGHFRLDLKIAADYELMFRLMYKNEARVKYLPKTIAKMRAGGISNSSLKNYFISNWEVYQSWKLNGYSISPWIIIRKPLSKVFQLFKKQ